MMDFFILVCIDDKGWKDKSNLTCSYYEENSLCNYRAAKDYLLVSKNKSPQKHCCACGKSKCE